MARATRACGPRARLPLALGDPRPSRTSATACCCAAGPLLVTTITQRAVRRRRWRSSSSSSRGVHLRHPGRGDRRSGRPAPPDDRRQRPPGRRPRGPRDLSDPAGVVNLAVVLSRRSFLLGTAETFADIAGSALVATYVPKPALGHGELPADRHEHPHQSTSPARRSGRSLFAIGMSRCRSASTRSAPWRGAVLIGRMAPDALAGSTRSRPNRPTSARRSPTASAGSGTTRRCGRWHSRSSVFNVTFWAAWSVYVLLARERLGLNELGLRPAAHGRRDRRPASGSSPIRASSGGSPWRP